MNAMTTPRSRSTESTRHVGATGAGPPLEDPASNSDLVPAVIKFTCSFFLVSRRDGADTRKRLYKRAMNWRKRFVAGGGGKEGKRMASGRERRHTSRRQ